MKKLGIILLCILMLSACNSKEDVKKSSIEFKEGDVTIDLNDEYDLNNYITVNDKYTSFVAYLDVENSKIVINIDKKGSDELETIEKGVVIIPKKASSLEDLDYTKGFLFLTSELSYFENIIFDEMPQENRITSDGGMFWIDIINKNENTYTLKVGGSGSFGVIPFDITIDNPTNFSAQMTAEYFAVSSTSFENVKVDEQTSIGNFRFIPYDGELKIKVTADKLRIRSGHDTNAEVVGEVNTGEEYTSYERVVDFRTGLWHRIGDNQWIAGSTYDGVYVDIQ